MSGAKGKIKLGNTMNVGTFERGLVARDQIRHISLEAVVATGAVRLCLPVDLMQKLGLQVLRRINARMASGRTESFEMTEGVNVEVLDRLVTGALLVTGSELLIGQTALEATDLLVDCNRQGVIPNPDHPDPAVIRIYQPSPTRRPRPTTTG